jgi:hypothetical protein
VKDSRYKNALKLEQMMCLHCTKSENVEKLDKITRAKNKISLAKPQMII